MHNSIGSLGRSLHNHWSRRNEDSGYKVAREPNWVNLREHHRSLCVRTLSLIYNCKHKHILFINFLQPWTNVHKSYMWKLINLQVYRHYGEVNSKPNKAPDWILKSKNKNSYIIKRVKINFYRSAYVHVCKFMTGSVTKCFRELDLKSGISLSNPEGSGNILLSWSRFVLYTGL